MTLIANMPQNLSDLITPEMNATLKSLIFGESEVKRIKLISDRLYEEAIAVYNPLIDLKEDLDLHGKPIRNAKDLFLADDESFKKITSYHSKGLALEGYTATVDRCALLVANNKVKDLERDMVDLMKPFTGFSSNDLVNINLKLFNDVVDACKAVLYPIVKSWKSSLIH